MSENDIIEVAPVARTDRYAENMRVFRLNATTEKKKH